MLMFIQRGLPILAGIQLLCTSSHKFRSSTIPSFNVTYTKLHIQESKHAGINTSMISIVCATLHHLLKCHKYSTWHIQVFFSDALMCNHGAYVSSLLFVSCITPSPQRRASDGRDAKARQCVHHQHANDQPHKLQKSALQMFDAGGIVRSSISLYLMRFSATHDFVSHTTLSRFS